MKRNRSITAAITLLLLAGTANSSTTTNFMGLTIGDQFALPECKWDGSGYTARYASIFDQPIRPCWKHSNLKAKPGKALNTSGTFEIQFIPTKDKSPRGIDEEFTSLIIINGKIEGIQAPTNGFEDQEYLLNLLVGKFGKPTKSQTKSVQNLAGANFSSQNAQWKRPDAEIFFNGMESRVNFGFIQVLSPSAQRYLESEAAQKKIDAPSF